jgi:hypothetical protein
MGWPADSLEASAARSAAGAKVSDGLPSNDCRAKGGATRHLNT